jgi:hypothetical protein
MEFHLDLYSITRCTLRIKFLTRYSHVTIQKQHIKVSTLLEAMTMEVTTTKVLSDGWILMITSSGKGKCQESRLGKKVIE